MSLQRYNLVVRHHFCAAHRLPNGPKKCQRLHGHTWDVEVSIAVTDYRRRILDQDGDGMIVDFGKVKEIIDTFDHQDLNSFFENPTAEVVATNILQMLEAHMRFEATNIIVTVWESPECSASVTGGIPAYEVDGSCLPEAMELEETDDT